jgi:hypothetical protein
VSEIGREGKYLGETTFHCSFCLAHSAASGLNLLGIGDFDGLANAALLTEASEEAGGVRGGDGLLGCGNF